MRATAHIHTQTHTSGLVQSVCPKPSPPFVGRNGAVRIPRLLSQKHFERLNHCKRGGKHVRVSEEGQYVGK